MDEVPSPDRQTLENPVATVAQCEQALRDLSAMLAAGDSGSAASFDRTVSCRLRDLDVVFFGRLRDGVLQDMIQTQSTKADIRLSTNSDELIGLVDGSLSFGSAWASGRVKVEASVFDLLKLRRML